MVDPTVASSLGAAAPRHTAARPPYFFCFLAAGPSAGCASYAASCTPATARPLGSSRPAQAASHSAAVAVLHATLGPPGTVSAAARCGKCCSKMVRYQ